jgi:hypothetical protein
MKKLSNRTLTINTKELTDLIAAIGTRVKALTQTSMNDAAKNQAGVDLATALNNLKQKVVDIAKPQVAAADDHHAPEFWRKNLDYGERKACSECALKTATIRGEGVRECPFGLSIPRACKTAGDTVTKMAPLESVEEADRERFLKTNKLIFAYNQESKPCKYADKVLDDRFEKVDCNFGDTGEGFKSAPIEGSPLFPSVFQTVGMDGLYGQPLGWYGDNTSARNLFFGMFSYLGSDESTNITKISSDLGLAMKLLSKKVGG